MNQIKTGRFIALMRKERGLTQREFADRLGISDKTISKWERGNGMPEVSLMRPVCEILGIDLNELFAGEKICDADYKKMAEENLIGLVNETEKLKKNVVGDRVPGLAVNVDMDMDCAQRTNAEFWKKTGNSVLGEIVLPKWSSFLPSEEKLNLLGDLSGKRVLEIGCGNGRSLKYVKDAGGADLWGLDISDEQLRRARTFLAANGIDANLICSPMEEGKGVPAGYFDVVYSVYGIGWTTDIDKTFQNIYSYLKSGGIFVFSWSHPIHKCVSYEMGRLIFSNSYFDEKWYSADVDDNEIVLSNRMLSTYINALVNSGFTIEKIVEETDREAAIACNDGFAEKALMLPTAFAIKAKKFSVHF